MERLPRITGFKFTTICLAMLSFLLLPDQIQAQRGVEIKSKDDLSHKSGKLGAYRALVIGINDYQDKKIPALKTAVNDAREFAGLLKTRYGFEVSLLLDRQATRQTIMDRMRDLAANTSPDESVLIYFAGHGEVDRVLNDGWWVPADAIGGNSATYLDNMFVQRVMRGMKARHVLLVSDSCYSGTLFGESRSLPPLIDDRYYLNLYNEKSRWGMTSGNKTPVSDSGSGGHSIFAYQLIKALTKNEKPYITTQELYSQIAPIIANNSEQQPLCSPVRDTGDQGGGFVFVASTTAVLPSSYMKKSLPQADSDDLLRQKAALEQARQQLAMAKRPSVSTAGETGRDGRFIAYNNGTVSDTRTGLMWAAKDNGSNINWAIAKSYCENYRGGGYSDWRMPTQNELAGLYDAGKSRPGACNTSYPIHVATELIDITCLTPWASETRGSEAAFFDFNGGGRHWTPQSRDNGIRALPVRFGK